MSKDELSRFDTMMAWVRRSKTFIIVHLLFFSFPIVAIVTGHALDAVVFLGMYAICWLAVGIGFLFEWMAGL